MIQQPSFVSEAPNRRQFFGRLASVGLCLSTRGLEPLWAGALTEAADSRLVFDDLKSWQSHPQLRRLEVAFRFLQRTDLKTLAAGKHVIDAKAYALVDKSPSNPPEKSEFEAHRKYIDVHYVLSGQAMTGFAPVEKLTVTKPYDEKTDAASYAVPKSFSKLKMLPGKFAVFFPGGGHMPWCHLDGPHDVHRVVVKVEHDYGLTQ